MSIKSGLLAAIAVQIEYAPYGKPTGLCTAVATTAPSRGGTTETTPGRPRSV